MALTTVPASLSATALTLTTAAQPNITSVGTLTGLTVSGNIAGTLTTAAQTNITSVGTLSSLTVSGALNGTLSTAAQTNITSLGTLTALNVSGNVGLGFASSPSYPLEVQSGGVGTVFRAGTSFFSVDATGSASSPSLVFNGDTDTGFYRSAGDTIKFASAGVDRLTLTSSLIVDVGSTFNLAVGINGKLSLNDSTYAGWIQSNGSVRIDIDNDNNQTDRAFVVSKNNGAVNLLTILENTAATFAGTVDAVADVTISNTSTNSAGVKFATTSANRYIESTHDGIINIGTGATLGGGTKYLTIDSGGNVIINKSNFSSLPTGSKLNIFGDGTTLRLDGTSATTKSILFRNVNAGNPGEVYADGSLRFRTEDASTRITFHTNSSGSNNERMRIDSNGKVGIAEGGVIYASRFSVGKAANHTPGSVFTSSPSSFFSEAALGGTTGDTQKIAIFGGSDQSNVSGLAIYRYRRATGTNWLTDGFSLRQEVDASASIYDYINFAGGNVGIGTVTPETKLDISRGTDTTVYSTTGDQRSEAAITLRNLSQTTGTFAGIHFYAGAGTGSDWSINNVRTGSYAGDLTFKTRAGGGSTDWRERMRILNNGSITIGGSGSPRSVGWGDTKLQIEGTSATDSSISIIRNEAGNNPPYIVFAKSRGSSIGSSTVVQNNDDLGSLRWVAADGSDLANQAAQISAQVDGTPGTDDTPGRLMFFTSPDGSNSAQERMRITAAGEHVRKFQQNGRTQFTERHHNGSGDILLDFRRFYHTSSNFNNPTINLLILTANNVNYCQACIYVKVRQMGISVNRAVLAEGFCSHEKDANANWQFSSAINTQSGASSPSYTGSAYDFWPIGRTNTNANPNWYFSTSGQSRTVGVTLVRATNYDQYIIEVEVFAHQNMAFTWQV